MKFLGRLQLWQKLAMLIFAMAVPTALLAYFYLSEANGVVRKAQSEIDGARYLQAVGSTMAQIANHRSRSHALLNGDASRRDDVFSAQMEVDKLMADVDRLDAELGTQLKTTQQWQAIKSQWSNIKASVQKFSPDENIKAHDALITRIMDLSMTVSMESGLSMDPDPVTKSLIVGATQRVSDMLIALGNMSQHAIGAAVKGYLGGDDRIALEIYGRNFLKNLEDLQEEMQWTSQEARTAVSPVIESANRDFAAFRDTINSKIVTAENMEITAAQVFDAGVPASRSLQELTRVAYAAMTKALEDRASSAATTRNLTVATVAIVLMFSLALSWLITRALSQPLSQAISVFGSIAAGHYDNVIDTSATDEAGQVLRALDEMQAKLRAQIETERAQAAENARIRQALDKVSTNVVLADASHNIIYVNETAEKTFARTQAEIRKSLPGFDAARLRGSSLDVLSTDPAQQRRRLEMLTGSEIEDRVLGGCSFRTVTNPVVSRDGERIGTVMEWTDRTPEVAVEKEMQTMLAGVLSGDLRQRISLEGKTGFFEVLARGVNELADNMAEIVRKVKHAASEVYRGAEEISQGNANLSQRTEEQSSSLEETASSMEEMTSTVKQNADNAGQANQLAMAARDQAEKGGAVVAKAVRAMTEINEASKKIADIIGVIDEIAFQTNLLALNAAVEAARAGEQGRGFAVVASEVRNLAGRSATAAKEIKELIQDSVRKVEDGSTLVTQSGQTLEQIVASVKKVSDIVAEIAAASREQSSGIEQVNRAVMQMDELTQQNAALVEQATAASQAMAEQARELNEHMARFKVGDDVEIKATSTHTASAESSKAPQPAPFVERRSANRPWANRTNVKAAEPASVAPAVPVRKVAVNAADADWQEF